VVSLDLYGTTSRKARKFTTIGQALTNPWKISELVFCITSTHMCQSFIEQKTPIIGTISQYIPFYSIKQINIYNYHHIFLLLNSKASLFLVSFWDIFLASKAKWGGLIDFSGKKIKLTRTVIHSKLQILNEHRISPPPPFPPYFFFNLNSFFITQAISFILSQNPNSCFIYSWNYQNLKIVNIFQKISIHNKTIFLIFPFDLSLPFRTHTLKHMLKYNNCKIYQ